MIYNSTKIELPLSPLSVNKAWRGGPRYRTKDYLQFERDVCMLLPKRATPIEGYLKIRYFFYIKNWVMSDTQNFLKTLTDSLVKCGLIKDDRYIVAEAIQKFKVERKEDEHIDIDLQVIADVDINEVLI